MAQERVQRGYVCAGFAEGEPVRTGYESRAADLLGSLTWWVGVAQQAELSGELCLAWQDALVKAGEAARLTHEALQQANGATVRRLADAMGVEL